MAALHITAENYEREVLKSDIPVMIDFWATWCGPCQMFGPTVEKLADDYAGKIKICKVNVDEEKELAKMFKIFSIPTVVLIRDGQIVKKSSGVMSESETKAWLEA